VAGIYIHIPYCKKACNYCNFHFSTSLQSKNSFLEAIKIEIELQKHFFKKDDIIETLYFGGGTPSILTPSEIKYIIEEIAKYFDLSQLKECTLEANPDDLDSNYLTGLKSSAINRLSIGIQSFYDEDLKFMNRTHSSSNNINTIQLAQDMGFENLTIDLIYGTPGLSNEAWLYNLSMIHKLELKHFSSYNLTIEEGTALHYAVKTNKTPDVNQEQSAIQFELLMQFASQNGFEHYEISNFAYEQHYALHNTNYWKGIAYLGLGPSAHSFDGFSRTNNIANNALYIQSLVNHRELLHETEHLTSEQKVNEYLLTSLRTMWGCDMQHLSKLCSANQLQEIKKSSQPFIKKDWLQVNQHFMKLTNSGKLYADYIASELFLAT
jgi:oxygen-independent coproporphyrinogen-3 oxidase